MLQFSLKIEGNSGLVLPFSWEFNNLGSILEVQTCTEVLSLSCDHDHPSFSAEIDVAEEMIEIVKEAKYGLKLTS